MQLVVIVLANWVIRVLLLVRLAITLDNRFCIIKDTLSSKALGD